MKNVSEKLDVVFHPKKTLVIYQSEGERDETYVEAYDLDARGCPFNAHPLSVRETIALANCLNTVREVRTGYLGCRGLLPDRLLHINHSRGCAVWYTPPQRVNLLFSENLAIPQGMASVPALLWKADRESLSLFALKAEGRPKIGTPLYRAPFFNVYDNGIVCMGTVDTDFSGADGVEEFIQVWQKAFFESYFSHLNSDTSPVDGNIVLLWKGLVESGSSFPKKVLIKQDITLKDILE